jgi:hypothetical protein
VVCGVSKRRDPDKVGGPPDQTLEDVTDFVDAADPEIWLRIVWPKVAFLTPTVLTQSTWNLGVSAPEEHPSGHEAAYVPVRTSSPRSFRMA